MKIGDKVRFLSEVGGGIVTGFQGKDFVLVEDADGFDIPIGRFARDCKRGAPSWRAEASGHYEVRGT